MAYPADARRGSLLFGICFRIAPEIRLGATCPALVGGSRRSRRADHPGSRAPWARAAAVRASTPAGARAAGFFSRSNWRRDRVFPFFAVRPAARCSSPRKPVLKDAPRLGASLLLDVTSVPCRCSRAADRRTILPAAACRRSFPADEAAVELRRLARRLSEVRHSTALQLVELASRNSARYPFGARLTIIRVGEMACAQTCSLREKRSERARGRQCQQACSAYEIASSLRSSQRQAWAAVLKLRPSALAEDEGTPHVNARSRLS